MEQMNIEELVLGGRYDVKYAFLTFLSHVIHPVVLWWTKYWEQKVERELIVFG